MELSGGVVGPVVHPSPTPTPSVSPTPKVSPTPIGYSSCDAACKDQKEGANAKYTGGKCVGNCVLEENEIYTNFDCTKEGKPTGNVCCCAKVVTGTTCKRSIDCKAGEYCSGGLISISERNKCKEKRGIFGNCDSGEEIEFIQKNICKPELLCFLGGTGSGFDPKTCQPKNCQLVFPNAKCCTAIQTCTGPMETTDYTAADCPGRCCTECT